MARRHGVTRGFVRPPKKTVMWIGINGRTAPLAVGGGVGLLDQVLTATELALRPFTIMRSRGLILVSSDQVAASESYSGVYSGIVVTDSATAAGIGSIPTPITQPEASYFLNVPLSGSFLFGDATGFQGGASPQPFTFDSKAMRKVGIDDDVALVVENLSATVGFSCWINGRMLIQLH